MDLANTIELKISLTDWIYIIIIGAFFGFFISLFFYFLNEDLQTISTLIFSSVTAIFISLLASLLITISNNFILPMVNRRFWYGISFFFSFCSGAIGFLFSFMIFLNFDIKITNTIEPFWTEITITIGFLTFLIGLILHQFISMKYKNETTKSEILELKIKALENELNPHFLFNALNSMSELVYLDPKKAEISILNLSKFLRNAIDTTSLLSLEKELNMVKTYVEIENIRFDDAINLEIFQKNGNKKIFIPKFSIQLLVENAIKHGFLGGKLTIGIFIEEDKIVVENDGKLSKDIKFGTGLTNLEKRLKFLDIGMLSVEKDEKMRFCINIKSNNK